MRLRALSGAANLAKLVRNICGMGRRFLARVQGCAEMPKAPGRLINWAPLLCRVGGSALGFQAVR